MAATNRDELGRFAVVDVPEKGRDGIRGKDRKKFAGNWEDLVIYHTFDDGWFIADFHTPKDLETLGRMGGGCSGSHVWTIKKKLEHIMALCEPTGVPKSVLHFISLEEAWLNIPNDTSFKGCYNNLTYVSSIMDNEEPYRRGENEGKIKTKLEQNISFYEENLNRHQIKFDALKQKALDSGIPLGRDNPYKYQIDELNRYKASAKEALKRCEEELAEIEASKKASIKEDKIISTTGRRTVIDGKHFLLIYCGGYGSTSVYDEKVSDWMDTLPDSKTTPLKHASLPKAEIFPTIKDLKNKVFECKDDARIASRFFK